MRRGAAAGQTARDNRTGGGGVNYASTTVQVTTSAGPFTVTQPNTAVSWARRQLADGHLERGEHDRVSPVSCANVAIALSTDGGTTFSNLVASTPNDGTQSVTIPSTPTTQARIRVTCVGNIFFDISNANFTIT